MKTFEKEGSEKQLESLILYLASEGVLKKDWDNKYDKQWDVV